MRNAMLVLFATSLACGAAATPVVTVTPLAIPSVEVARSAQDDCRIEGNGDRSGASDGENPFELFPTRRSHDAVLVLTEPAETHVAWNEFPGAQSDDRARVEIGGQLHVRWAAYAALHGRIFSLTRRFAAEPNHLWARAGAPVEMIGYENGVAVARVETPFDAPKTLAVRGACNAIAYVPEEPDHEDPKSRDAIASASTIGATLDLYVSAEAETPFTTITLASPGLIVDVISRAKNFSRVHTIEGNVELDAWVKSSQISEDAVGYGSSSGFGSSSCGGAGGTTVTVARDAQLFVGVSPAMLAGAVVEQGAQIYVDAAVTLTVDRRELVPFTFVDGMVAAPDNSRMWIARNAYAR